MIVSSAAKEGPRGGVKLATRCLQLFPVVHGSYSRAPRRAPHMADTAARVGKTCGRTRTSDARLSGRRYVSRTSFPLKANLPETLEFKFKFNSNLPTMASKMLQGFPLCVSHYSKFINLALVNQAY